MSVARRAAPNLRYTQLVSLWRAVGTGGRVTVEGSIEDMAKRERTPHVLSPDAPYGRVLGQRGYARRRYIQAWSGTGVWSERIGRQLGSRSTTSGPDRTGSRGKPDVVLLTDAAIERLRVLLKRRKEQVGEDGEVVEDGVGKDGSGDGGKEQYIRLGVKRRGCNGLAYTLNYDDTKKRFDEEVEREGVKLLVDSMAVMHVLNTEMDFVEDEVRSEFVFRNPNASGTCGCGESFTTKEDEFTN